MKSKKGSVLETFLIALTTIICLVIALVLICATAVYTMEKEQEGLVIDKQYYSANWIIQINQKERTVWIGVDENTYNNLKIGGYYKGVEEEQ